jgi:biopolymer transport protein ExbB
MRRHLNNALMIITLAMFALAVLKPANAYAWWNGDWTARKVIVIDTSAAGGGIADPIGTTPVLIRLDVSNLSFDNANPDGSDLRFVAADDKTPLAYHIEKYDNLLGQAFVWVSVPDLKPGTQTTLYMYYGNKKAAAADDAKATFDASTVLVYHFDDKGAPAKDWSGNGNTAATAGQQDDFAVIGPGLRLDGQTPVTLPATPTLAWSGGNALTWSLWVNETALQPNAVLYSRTDGTSTMQIGIDNGAPFVAVTTAAGTQRTTAGAAIAAASWHHIAVVATAQQITLFVDGASYATLNTALPALNTIAYLGGDATTGIAAAATPPATPATPPAAAAASPAATPAATPTTPTIGFIGSIDELEISNVARPAGFIKFAALSQGSDPLAAKLITYGVEQKQASWFSGYLVVILGSVTVDGWVVIAILALMAIISWVVMADKISYVNRTAKANEVFTEQFSHMAYDLTAIDKAAPETGVKALESSPLYHMYHIGARELRLRFPGQVPPEHKILSMQSIAAIRSALDTSLVRETQKLNKSMVLLTIAIAGGPFLGLLGTVVGVMITFASIAASGDVNVNAIAPGISAALVATVAGLVVAIPALFGYNYLNSRITEEVLDMQVFADEFVTKMAEYYSPRTVERAAE